MPEQVRAPRKWSILDYSLISGLASQGWRIDKEICLGPIKFEGHIHVAMKGKPEEPLLS